MFLFYDCSLIRPNNMKKWRLDPNTNSFVREDGVSILYEYFLTHQGKYNKPSDELLDALVIIKESVQDN